jgi:uncharacterized protein
MPDSRTAAALLSVLLALGACGRAPAPAAGEPDALFDHHAHLLSPALVRDWKALGVPFSRPDSAYTSATALLAEPRLTGAFLLSMGYLYSSAAFRQGLALSEAAEYAGVRAENDHVAAEAARAPGRLTGFCGVNPRRPHAMRELARCRDSLRLGGVKVHLAASDVDPRDSAHVAAVAAVAAWADSSRLPVMLHFDPQRPDLDPADLDLLVTRVIRAHPSLRLYVAHLGGSGGYGERTRQVFQRLVRAARDRAEPLRFDISAVVLDRSSEGVPPTTADEAARLAADLREAGGAQVVFGSDWPVFTPGGYAATLVRRLPEAGEALARLFEARPPTASPPPAAGRGSGSP